MVLVDVGEQSRLLPPLEEKMGGGISWQRKHCSWIGVLRCFVIGVCCKVPTQHMTAWAMTAILLYSESGDVDRNRQLLRIKSRPADGQISNVADCIHELCIQETRVVCLFVVCISLLPNS